MAIVLQFADGSVGTVNYFSSGSKSFPKETVEMLSNGRVLRMEDSRVTRGYGFAGFKKFRTNRQNKGHNADIATFVDGIAEGDAPLTPFAVLSNITYASLAAVESTHM